MTDNKTENRTEKKNRLALIIPLVIALAAMCAETVRCFYGIDMGDESFYVSESLGLFQGMMPFVEKTNSGVGMSFLLLPVMWIYSMFSPDLSGVILALRLTFMVFRFAVWLTIFLLLKKHVPSERLMWAMLVLAPFTGSCGTSPGLALSYNTIGALFMLLSGVLLYCAVNEEQGRSYAAKLVSAGFLSGIAVFAHPLQAFTVITLMTVLFISEKKGRRFKSVLLYASGGIAEILIVMIPVMAQSGPDALLKGLGAYVGRKASMKRDTMETLVSIKAFFLKFWFFMCATFGAAAVFFFAFKKKLSLEIKDIFMCAAAASAFEGTAFVMLQPYNDMGMPELGAAGMLCMFFTFFFGKKNRLVYFVSLPCFIFILLEIFVAATDRPSNRFVFMVPAVWVFVLVLITVDRKMLLRAACATAVMALVCELRQFFVFRDLEEGAKLDTKMGSGPYAGLYTCKEKADQINALQTYIKDNTDPGDRVAFRDSFSAGYLMSDGLVWADSTWDTLHYFENANANDYCIYLFEFYQRTGAIPDTVFYVEKSRATSIDDDSVTYTDFVKQYYDETGSREFEGSIKRIRIFTNNGTFDGNLEKWME